MNPGNLDPRLPVMQNADLAGKVVLVRVDHNVVKKGVVKDPYRIDATLATLYRVVEGGGRPILMTHVGRPRDKKTGNITADENTAVRPVVDYLETKLSVRFVVPDLGPTGDQGITGLQGRLEPLVQDLRDRRIPGVYLPNTRWFQGEETKGDSRDRLAGELASLADVYVNDAFGSWQPHASTFDITRHLPAFAGMLMQKEITNLQQVLSPERPFLAVVAGSKVDTKIGPLRKIHQAVDSLILGGVLYNAYLCAKYGIRVKGVQEEDIQAAGELVRMDEGTGKILELPGVVESGSLSGREEGNACTRWIKDMVPEHSHEYFLDIDPGSFDTPEVKKAFQGAGTIFVNAVMGLTPPFGQGTKRLNREVALNAKALKLFGGGDTLQELKSLNPGLFLSAVDDPAYYFFTGGGTVLKALEQGSPFDLEPVKALIENGGRPPA